jgi:hypothetical protein
MRAGLKNQVTCDEKLRFRVVVSRTCGGAGLAERGYMRSLAVLLLLLGGCDLYFGGDDDPPPCAYGATGGGAAEPANGYRDPYTGQCEYYGGGGYPCDGTCGPCPEYDMGASQPYDWASCYSQCEALDEGTCAETSGCYVAYIGDANAHKFLGCFATAPSGPVQGSCAGLDAYSCSRHDDCSALYSATNGQYFTECLTETASGCDCEMGYHCEQQCDANVMCGNVCVSDYTCASVDCAPGYTCTEVCDGGTCGPKCVPSQHEPGECYGAVTCNEMAPACPSNTTPGVSNGCYTGYCIPLSDCGPKDPGTCTGAVACATPPPACPAGTTAGRKNGCWSGYCIPDSQCPLASCATLTTESSCVSRADCSPVYTGADCTCYPDHCECNDLTFDRCEAL